MPTTRGMAGVPSMRGTSLSSYSTPHEELRCNTPLSSRPSAWYALSARKLLLRESRAPCLSTLRGPMGPGSRAILVALHDRARSALGRDDSGEMSPDDDAALH